MNIETANRLLQYRKENNLSQEELAEKIGVSRQAVSKWERAEASPDTDNLIRLAEIYGVSLDEMLTGKKTQAEPQAQPEPEPQADEAKSEAFEPDPDTNYKRYDKVSFKNGIHVESKDGDKVHISYKDGVNVYEKNGDKVHVSWDGIQVEENGKNHIYTDENGHVMVDEELEHRRHRKKVANLIPMWAIALAAFFIWGFSGVMCGWALSWVCFLAIPIYHSLVDAIFSRNPNHFAYPVLCVAFQMIAGFLFGGWAWSWIAYLTIPVYYGICTVIKKGEE